MICYAEKLADYVARTRFEDLPETVVAHAKWCVLDSIGVGLASRLKPWAVAALNVADALGGTPESTVWGGGEHTSDANAALVNAMYAHSMDFNDDLAGIQVGAIMPPTALAVAEACGASGKDLITAVVLGYDMATRVAVAIGSQELYLRGFQPTAVAGVFAATATAAKLYGLSREQTANAFGIAASYSGGTIEFLKDGTDTKRFHVAKAAHGGVLAAKLAARGMTGPNTIFEGEFGVLRAYSRSPSLDSLLEGLGTRYDIVNTSFKPYPFCDGNGAPLDATLELMRENGIAPSDISKLHYRIKSFLIPYVVNYHGDTERKYRPKNELDAQMSLPYCIAVGVLSNGEINLAHFDPEAFDDPAVHALADKVTAQGDEELDLIPLLPMSMPAIVSLTTANGEVFEKRVDYQKGDPRNPFTKDDFLKKFRQCAAASLRPQVITALEEKLLHLEQVGNLREVTRCLS